MRAAIEPTRSGVAAHDDDDDVRKAWSVAVVLAAAFLHLLGFTMMQPLTPALGAHFSLEGSRLGALTSAYPLGMLAALFVWPALSDRVGRKPVLAASLTTVGLGFVLQGAAVHLGWSLTAFLTVRAMCGACACASPVAKAYLADLGSDDQLPRWMAWREAASTLAFIVGPTLGGVLGDTLPLAAVITLSGVASVLAGALVLAVLVKPPPRTPAAAPSAGKDGASTLRKVADTELLKPWATPVSCPLGTRLYAAVASICAVSSLYHVGQVVYDAFFAVYISRPPFGLSTAQIGGLLSCSACVSFAVSTAGFHRVQRSLGIPATSVLGLCLIGTCLLCLGHADALWKACACVLFYAVGVPLFTPTVPILLLRCVPPSRRGAVMGLDSFVNTVSRVLAPLALGAVFESGGAASCFSSAAFFVFGAATLTALRVFLVRRASA